MFLKTKKTDTLQHTRVKKTWVLGPGSVVTNMARPYLFIHKMGKQPVLAPLSHVTINQKKVTVIIAIYHHQRINVVFPVINLLLQYKLVMFRCLKDAAIQPGYCMTEGLSFIIALTLENQMMTYLIKLLEKN